MFDLYKYEMHKVFVKSVGCSYCKSDDVNMVISSSDSVNKNSKYLCGGCASHIRASLRALVENIKAEKELARVAILAKPFVPMVAPKSWIYKVEELNPSSQANKRYILVDKLIHDLLVSDKASCLEDMVSQFTESRFLRTKGVGKKRFSVVKAQLDRIGMKLGAISL